MSESIPTEVHACPTEMKNVCISETADGFVAALIDSEGLEVVRGFGQTAIEAFNDMKQNLI